MYASNPTHNLSWQRHSRPAFLSISRLVRFRHIPWITFTLYIPKDTHLHRISSEAFDRSLIKGNFDTASFDISQAVPMSSTSSRKKIGRKLRGSGGKVMMRFLLGDSLVEVKAPKMEDGMKRVSSPSMSASATTRSN